MTRIKQISIVIPTLNRGEILLDTLLYLMNLEVTVDKIIVVDQTMEHSKNTRSQLTEWNRLKKIVWHRLSKPSVVAAMNAGLKISDSKYVLFLDDDINPIEGLVDNFSKFTIDNEYSLVAGRVIQPWDDPEGLDELHSDNFSFNALKNSSAKYFIGANFLVNRKEALELGGFDENFVSTAHDYEREFSDRVILSGEKIAYCASAAVHHLKEESGGIRTYGHFLKTIKPHHAVGAYYYILTSNLIDNKIWKILTRLRQRVVTKTHLRAPWWIPLTLIGDLTGLSWAIILYMSGPKLINVDKVDQTSLS